MISTGSQVEVRPQGRLVDWILRRQLTLFFTLTLLVSWLIWGIMSQIPINNSTTISRIVLIGAFTPSIFAILISSITTSNPRSGVSNRYWRVFLPTLIIAVGSEWLDHIWWGHQINLSLVLVDCILAILAALVITRLVTNRADIHLRFTGVPQWWIWVPVSLGFWPLLVLVGNTIARLLGISLPSVPAWPEIPLPFIILEAFLWTVLYGGPLNEEPGWRGFALPRLQNRFSPLIAGIIIGVIWGLWHVPAHLLGMYSGGPLGAIIRIQEIPRAILFTWLYNHTKGNLLIMLLFHAAINTTSYFITRSYEVTFVLLFIVAIAIVCLDKMWRKLPDRDGIDKQEKIFIKRVG